MNTTREHPRNRVAAEAARYLEVVDSFAALNADPHAAARARARSARTREDHTTQPSARSKGVFRWRS
jgi:hypothetical protein